MTSKQALYDLIDEIKYTHNDGKTLTPFDKKRIDIIAKDLEVLKVLRKYVQTATLLDNDTMVFRIDAIFMWDDADYKKIKRWVENDRIRND